MTDRFDQRNCATQWKGAPCGAPGLLLSIVLVLGGCAHTGADAPPSGDDARMITLADGLRIDRDRGIVEFDGAVAIDAHHPDTPDVYLELIVTSPQRREYESLVVTPVPASMIHAALLAAGFEPGQPGLVRTTTAGVERVPPRGDRVGVELLTSAADGASRTHHVTDWIVLETSEPGVTAPWSGPEPEWVFAGSREGRQQTGDGTRTVYDADMTGTIVGLTTFGSETVALTRVASPESAIDAPVWMADVDAVPTQGTPVTVRLTRRE